MHLDINTQMNYWPCEVTNLAECHVPLFRWIEEKLVPSGRETAKLFYGLNGWVAELVSNAWGFTDPYWHVNLSPCPTGGCLDCHPYVGALSFNRSYEFLKNHAYPVIREAVLFLYLYLHRSRFRFFNFRAVNIPETISVLTGSLTVPR